MVFEEKADNYAIYSKYWGMLSWFIFEAIWKVLFSSYRACGKESFGLWISLADFGEK